MSEMNWFSSSWFSPSEQLPHSYNVVLGHSRDKEPFIGWYSKDDNVWVRFYLSEIVLIDEPDYWCEIVLPNYPIIQIRSSKDAQ